MVGLVPETYHCQAVIVSWCLPSDGSFQEAWGEKKHGEEGPPGGWAGGRRRAQRSLESGPCVGKTAAAIVVAGEISWQGDIICPKQCFFKYID